MMALPLKKILSFLNFSTFKILRFTLFTLFVYFLQKKLMEKTTTNFHTTPIVGLKIRTSFEKESSPQTSRIAPLVKKYLEEGAASGIPDRRKPGVTFCVYYEYQDDDHMGEYSYLIGEEVTSISAVPDYLEIVRIPEGKYVKFTTDPGKMPELIVDAWKEIWEIPSRELGGRRAFNVDFEVYDERAHKPEESIIDIYIGVK